ncbi:MAG TPA: class I SAM-dependent methyltransferase [Candidatus Paceibacterota bacterium]|nr:class I SAM-dependent methyltransferase [Candidatus Paceibacterota bacterium]
MSENGEFYRGKGVSPEELRRLNSLKRPNERSQELLNQLDMTNKNLLDVGAGSNPELGSYMKVRNGGYTAIDVNPAMVASMNEAFKSAGLPYESKQEDIVAGTSFASESFDVAHERFVLMNIKPETRAAAIQEMVRVAKEGVVLMEYDWSTFSSTSHPELIASVKQFVERVFTTTNTDPYMGGKLEAAVREALPDSSYTKERFLEPESPTFLPEMLALMESIQANAKRYEESLSDESQRNMAKMAGTMAGMLAVQLEKDQPSFIPPAIDSVTIRK